MVVSDLLEVPPPVRYSLAGGFGLAVVLASMMHPPGTVLAEPGPFGLFGWDKWVHVFSYATFAALAAYAVLARTWVAVVAILLVSTVSGAAVEGIQGTIPWRNQELADVYANALGAAVGLAGWQIATRFALDDASGSATDDRGSTAADGGPSEGSAGLD